MVSVAIPEGYNVFDIAKTLEENQICSAKDFYAAVSTTEGYDYDWLADFPSDRSHIGFILEGFLFPATYDFSMNSDAKVIVDKMLAAFDDRLSDKITAYCKENNMSHIADVNFIFQHIRNRKVFPQGAVFAHRLLVA